MMGQQDSPQQGLFYTRFNLEKRVRADHPLRAIAREVDFDFVYDEVEPLYGAVGNVSVPPPVILKLMFLLAYYNVPSERELLDTVPERLDWLWFLGLDLDSAIPDHSILSKARARWGPEVFRNFFERIVAQCNEKGLIDGTKIFCDSSLIDANASVDSIIRPVVQLREVSGELERRLGDSSEAKSHPYSSTDPDASIVGKRPQPPRPRYKTHRSVDTAHGVITATTLTPGAISEANQLMELLDQHEQTTGVAPEVVVADSIYGTVENYLKCQEREVQAHIPPLAEVNNQARLRHEGKFGIDQFRYDQRQDVYICPAGKTLRRSSQREENVFVYAARRRDCRECPLRAQCTNSDRRRIRRHLKQDVLEVAHRQARSPLARADLKRRKHFLEGSFAQAVPYGYKRARWRRLWRVRIQDYLIAAVQNIQKLIQCCTTPSAAAAKAAGVFPSFVPNQYFRYVLP